MSSQHELLAIMWAKERMTELGTMLMSVLHKLRFWGIDRKGYRPSDENVQGIPSHPEHGSQCVAMTPTWGVV